MTEIGNPEEREITVEPIYDPIPRTIPVPVPEEDEWDEEWIEVEEEDGDRELVPA